MNRLNTFMDAIADFFGTARFLLIYNVFSIIWVTLGVTDKAFIDPYPSNFYTFLVSWLAIDMTCFVLLKERRSKEREQQEEKRRMEMLEAIVKNTSETKYTNELVLQIARNQTHLMDEIMKRKEE